MACAAFIAILASAALNRIPADSPPQVKSVESYRGGNATFQTNFRIYDNGAPWPTPIEKELRKINGIIGVTIPDPFCLVIAIARPFAGHGVPEKAKGVILSFAPRSTE